MADRVFTQEDILVGEAPDDFEITIRPNLISRQRKAMAIWDKGMDEMRKKGIEAAKAAEEADKSGKQEEFDPQDYQVDRFDTFVDMVGVSLEKVLQPHFEGTMFNQKRELTKEYREYLEDNFDQETIARVIKVCVGIDLDGPKATETAEELSGVI